jgi:hypothetical protein
LGVSGATSGSTQAAGLTLAPFTTATVANTTTRSVNGTLRLYNPGSAYYKFFTFQVGMFDSSRSYSVQGGSEYQSATAVNAFRIVASSGNLASGTVRCYGIAH